MNVYKEGGIYVIESDVYEDDRGYFLESYSEKSLSDIGLNVNFVQDNISKSTIMFTDIVGYSAMVNKDQEHAMELLSMHDKIIEPIIKQNGGKIIKKIE